MICTIILFIHIFKILLINKNLRYLSDGRNFFLINEFNKYQRIYRYIRILVHAINVYIKEKLTDDISIALCINFFSRVIYK